MDEFPGTRILEQFHITGIVFQHLWLATDLTGGNAELHEEVAVSLNIKNTQKRRGVAGYGAGGWRR